MSRCASPRTGTSGTSRRLPSHTDAFSRGLDLAISLGGDGTMLRTVDAVYECGAAVLGVNVGRPSATWPRSNLMAWTDALERLVAGRYTVEERMMLAVAVESAGPAKGRWWP